MKTKIEIVQKIQEDIELKAKEMFNGFEYKNYNNKHILALAAIAEILLDLVADLIYDKQNNKGETNTS